MWRFGIKRGSENVVADHLSRMNREDDKEPIKDKMRDDHLFRVLDKDTWMINIIRAIRKMPLDHLYKNAQRRCRCFGPATYYGEYPK
jgi:hypothetical protein